jgi:hypothetical protein
MFGLAVVAIACATGADMMGEIMDSGVPDAGAETPGDGTSMQYVGNTSQTFLGDVGLYPAYAACQSDYGAGNRICTADEIKFTTKLPQLTGGEVAWYSLEGCSDWTSASSGVNGLLVNSKGNVTGSTGDSRCFQLHPFACCGPK